MPAYVAFLRSDGVPEALEDFEITNILAQGIHGFQCDLRPYAFINCSVMTSSPVHPDLLLDVLLHDLQVFCYL
ncbi:MAG: hypothetical protein ABSE48_05390 [Verrucomicrobiota bacterium]|jgi:hypothetical protein